MDFIYLYSTALSKQFYQSKDNNTIVDSVVYTCLIILTYNLVY